MADTNETVADIIAEMRSLSNPISDGIIAIDGRTIADRLDAAHKREVDALKQRCAELDAEVAAKDEVIKRLNDAIADEQRRKTATTEKSSAVGDCAKLRKAALRQKELLQTIYSRGSVDRRELCAGMGLIDAALAAPPRNCDTKEPIDSIVKRFKAENCDQYDNAWDDPRTQCHQNCVECIIKWMMAEESEAAK